MRMWRRTFPEVLRAHTHDAINYPGDTSQFTFMDNSYPVLAGRSGDTKLVECLPGFRSSWTSSVTFNTPCSTFVEVSCSSAGNW